eukprot:PLAT7048.2.p2 GENE.PLAT7048.2~~PLAT7048.2.p2  ORF type:complete len:216 (+),score=6.72 PLAT7048.2:124-771(+)
MLDVDAMMPIGAGLHEPVVICCPLVIGSCGTVAQKLMKLLEEVLEATWPAAGWDWPSFWKPVAITDLSRVNDDWSASAAALLPVEPVPVAALLPVEPFPVAALLPVEPLLDAALLPEEAVEVELDAAAEDDEVLEPELPLDPDDDLEPEDVEPDDFEPDDLLPELFEPEPLLVAALFTEGVDVTAEAVTVAVIVTVLTAVPQVSAFALLCGAAAA